MTSTLHASRPARDGRIQWREHADESAFAERVAQGIEEAIAAGRGSAGGALVLLSGGATPAPVYRELGRGRPGFSDCAVALVDERWVEPGSPGSNARMIGESLLHAPGAGVRFQPLALPELGLQASVDSANRAFLARGAPSLVVLGMGDDGHTASLFPGSGDLARALAAPEAYVAIDAAGCAGAGAWPLRISLTPAGWRGARRRMLLLRGAGKRRVFARALEDGDALELPVRAAIDLGDAPLEVHWYP